METLLMVVLTVVLFVAALAAMDGLAPGRWYHRAVYFGVVVWGTGKVAQTLETKGILPMGEILSFYPILVGIIAGDFVDCEFFGQACFWTRSRPEPDRPRVLAGTAIFVGAGLALGFLGFSSWIDLRDFLLAALFAVLLNHLWRLLKRSRGA